MGDEAHLFEALMNKFDRLLFPTDDRIIRCDRLDFMKILQAVNRPLKEKSE
jgi:hypothetical protein